MKGRLALALVAAMAAAGGPAQTAGEDLFTLELSAQAASQQQSAHGGPVTPQLTARAVLNAKPAARLRIRWTAFNQDKSALVGDVTIHVVLNAVNNTAQTSALPAA